MGHVSPRRAAIAASWAVLVSLAACTPPELPTEAPDDATTSEASAPASNTRAPVTFVATDFAFDGPASIPAGLTEVELVNDGESSHSMVIVGIGEERTLDDVLGVLGAEGPIPDWVDFAGGVGGIPPGARTSVIHDLAPGNYAVFSFEGEPSDATRGMIQALEVTAPDGTAAREPEPNVTVDLYDWRFETLGTLTRGPQTIAVHNQGEQPHEALIMRLSDDTTAEDVVEMITAFSAGGPPEEGAEPPAVGEDEAVEDRETGDTGTPEDASDAADAAGDGTPESGDGPPEGPPFDSAGGMGPIDPGESGWVNVELEPGRYMFICFIPDPNDGVMHLTKGMYQAFTVE